MSAHRYVNWTLPAIRAAATGLGTAVAGPLGGALFAWLGDSLGPGVAKLIEKRAADFGNEVAKDLFKAGAESLVEKLRPGSPQLESLFREALRWSLAQLRTQSDDNFEDWFDNWERCLASTRAIYLPSVEPDELVPKEMNDQLRSTLENIDRQGTANSQGIEPIALQCRVLPGQLLSRLTIGLPDLLSQNFRALIVTADYEEAWKQAQLIFQDQSTAVLKRLEVAAGMIDDKASDLLGLADDIKEIRRLLEPGLTKVVIPQYIPSPPPDFTGRTSLLEKLAADRDKGGFVICGMGGAGKSVLAKKLAEQLQSQYCDSQFYFDLQGMSQKPLSPREVMIHVITSLDSKAQIPIYQGFLEGLYRSMLANTRSLLLFDNARDASQVLPLLPPRSSFFIVTSRNYLSLDGFETVTMGAMSPEDAQSLLLKVAQRPGTFAEELARICGYLPIAIRLAAGVLNMRQDRSPSQYIQDLAPTEKRSELIDESFNLSYQFLSSATRCLWRQLAVFPAAFDAAAAAAVWRKKAGALDILGELIGYNVLEWDGEVQRYRLHDLARAFAETRMTPLERGTAQSRHASHFAGVAQRAFEVIISGKEGTVDRGFELLYSDWVNIAAGQGWAAANIARSEEAAALCSKYATSAAYFHLIKHDPPELVRWLKAAVRGDQRTANKRSEAMDLGMLGRTEVVAGDVPAAIRSIHKSLRVYEAIAEPREQIAQLFSLMELYSMRDEVAKAIAMGERALAVQRELRDTAGERDALMRLGQLCKDKGDYIRSAAYCQQATEVESHE